MGTALGRAVDPETTVGFGAALEMVFLSFAAGRYLNTTKAWRFENVAERIAQHPGRRCARAALGTIRGRLNSRVRRDVGAVGHVYPDMHVWLSTIVPDE